MKNDKLIFTGFLGIIATIPAEILSQILVYLGFAKYSIYDLSSLFITFNRPTILMGLFVDALISGTIAVLFRYIFEKLGPAYLVIKIIWASLLNWFACEMLFTSTVEGVYFELRPIRDYYSHMLSTVVFGITLGLLFKRFVFKKPIS